MHPSGTGRALKIDRSTIANLCRLLELPEPILEAVQTDKLSAGHARALLPLGEESQHWLWLDKSKPRAGACARQNIQSARCWPRKMAKRTTSPAAVNGAQREP